jgi:hypothetical protein
MYLGVIENPARPTSAADKLATIGFMMTAIAAAFGLASTFVARVGLAAGFATLAAVLRVMVPRVFPRIGRTYRRR